MDNVMLDSELQAARDKLDAMPPAERDATKSKLRASFAALDDLRTAKVKLAAAQSVADTLAAGWARASYAIGDHFVNTTAIDTAVGSTYRHLPELRAALEAVDAPFDPRLNVAPGAIGEAAAALSRGDPSRLLLPLREMFDAYQQRAVTEQQKAAQAVVDAVAAVADAERRANLGG